MALLDLLFDMYPMFKEKYDAEFGEKETTNQEKETTIDEKDITIKSLSNELITLKKINNLDERKMSYLAELNYDMYLSMEKADKNIPKENYLLAIQRIKENLTDKNTA